MSERTTNPTISTDADDASSSSAPGAGGASRRTLLGKGAMAAAVAATAGLAVSRSASAAPTGNFVIGEPDNLSDGSTDTGLTGGSTLVVTDGATAGVGSGASLRAASIAATQTVDDRIGIVATSSGADGLAVYGFNTGADGIGVAGEHTSTTVDGTGLIGLSTRGPGVVGRGTVADIEADGSGKVLFNKDAFAGLAPTGASAIGTLARDAQGSLWYSPKDGTWIKLAGLSSAGGAGTFHALAPVRVYDSRLAAPTQGKLATGQNRVVSIADARNEVTGSVVVADVVPVGATAVVVNLTVTQTEGVLGGFLSVVPGDATALSGSSINWSGPDQNIANGLTAKISADRKVNVFCGGVPTPKTHFVIDVSGYYA